MSNKIKRHKLSLRLYLSACLLALCGSAMAHEFWLEPVRYHVNKNDEIAVNIKVGKNFKGEPQIYNPSDFIKFQYTTTVDSISKTYAVKSRLGDMPAFKTKPISSGLKLVSYISTRRVINYKTAEKFKHFIKKEGIDWVLAAHAKRKLPEKGFKEVFYRYAKTLLAVGKGEGTDKVLSFPFEWVMLDNPYTHKNKDSLKAQLLWQGKVFPHAVVSLFIRQKDKLLQQYLKTDEKGIVKVPTGEQGVYLLNAVHMLEASDDTERETGAVWESLWASSTFEIKGQ